jgi:outer membrane autotransporter protein
MPDLSLLGFKPEDFGLTDFSLFQNSGLFGFGQQNLGFPGFGRQNFAAEPESDIASRADGAFAALGYASRDKEAANFTKAPAQPGREWNAWVNFGGGQFKVRDTSGSGNDVKGDGANVLLGFDRRIAPNTVVGVTTGYERLNSDVATLAASASYKGETIGGYIVQGFGNVRFDAALDWTHLDYDTATGATGGSYGGSRWRVTSGLTGHYMLGGFALQPSASVRVAFERDSAWTDTAGNAVAANNATFGRTALGALVARPLPTSSGWIILPYAGAYADWVFSSASNNVIPAGPTIGVIHDGWAGRVTAGVTAMAARGVVLAAGSEFGGLGENYTFWKGNLSASMPF